MPIKIDRARTQDLALQFDEALEVVRNEFEGLDTHRQYRNAFARLLKPDPLGRVLMMGTDQRDMFVPELRRAIEDCVPCNGHIFDFGAGDGQTFALVAASVPKGTCVSIEEPNPEYLKNYVAFLKTQPHLRLGMAVVAGFDDMDTATARLGETLPQDGSIDLGLALHMIYFVHDLSSSVIRMVRFLKPGGVLFLVVSLKRAATPATMHAISQSSRSGGACLNCQQRAPAGSPKCCEPPVFQWKSRCNVS
jgi:SAM-dependent methyltransferase